MRKYLNRTFLISFLVNGGTFAIAMAILDFSDDKPFRLWRFLFNLIFFGLFMALIFVWKRKKDSSK
ncbi:hypothetical protein [Spongiivirga citrea]|uniref:Uncharacterized protein n=1 Tax=Spongiivirga citrea TaxID=1481457 RepID=A0A6M0CPV3_9FLAO|nr:hypothetical protein [Spongiivirga citrea]NER15960.1 hypothetical protein [Spongiivirga citrea]